MKLYVDLFQAGYHRTVAVVVLSDHLGPLLNRFQRFAPLTEKHETLAYEMSIHLEIETQIWILLVALQKNCKTFVRARLRFAVFRAVEQRVAEPELNLSQKTALARFSEPSDQLPALLPLSGVPFARARPVSKIDGVHRFPLQRFPIPGSRYRLAHALESLHVPIGTDPREGQRHLQQSPYFHVGQAIMSRPSG